MWQSFPTDNEHRIPIRVIPTISEFPTEVTQLKYEKFAYIMFLPWHKFFYIQILCSTLRNKCAFAPIRLHNKVILIIRRMKKKNYN